ncbi:MAG TPA: polysaccharide deacetylase family protein [Propionibacteriaceae bacterium]|nr:polysaccharide deacetylase family protein [Propionibacteriaceae bacterium]
MTGWTPGHSEALTRTPIVALNFHEIIADHRTEVRRSLRHVAGLGPRYDPDEPGPVDGPRVFVAFYDGMRDAAMFGAEECANLGLKAYFFPLFDHYDPDLANVTDDQWRQIATVHEIGFHTASHAAVSEVTSRTVHREVVEPMVRIEAIAGYRPRIGAWKGGSRFDPGMVGDQTARAYGVRFLVSNWSIERVPPELDPSGDGPG